MKSSIGLVVLLTAVASRILAGDAPPHRLTPVPIQQVVVEDGFWSPKLKVWREVTIPDCFAKFERDGALTNFDRIRDGVAAYGVEMDRFNRVAFDPVETKALRIEVQLQPDWSGGILEWKVE